MHDRIVVAGSIEVLEHDASTGHVLSRFAGPNLVVNTGLDLIADRLRGNTGVSGASLYALGSGSTPTVAGDTALSAESYRGPFTQTQVSAGELTMTFFLGSTQGNGVTYQEGGAFNAENTMLCRAIFPARAKTSAKTLTVIHTIPVTAS